MSMDLLKIWSYGFKEDWEHLLQTIPSEYLANIANAGDFASGENCNEIVKRAMLLLQCFVQKNFTGFETNGFCEKSSGSYSDDSASFSDLTSDGISPSKNAQLLGFLVSAKRLLGDLDLGNVSPELKGVAQWTIFRTDFIHQLILSERSLSLRNRIVQQISDLLENSPEFLQLLPVALKIELLAEAVQAHLYYREITPASRYAQKVLLEAGVTPLLIGALGKRTRYQEKPVAQLCVDVQNGNGVTTSSDPGMELETGAGSLEAPYPYPSRSAWLPKNLALNDDTLLDSVKFEKSEGSPEEDSGDGLVLGEPIQLADHQLVALWAHVCTLQVSRAKDVLLKEEIIPYFDKVLANRSVWAIQYAALLARSRWEMDVSRRVERSLAQVELLCTSVAQSQGTAVVGGSDIGVKGHQGQTGERGGGMCTARDGGEPLPQPNPRAPGEDRTAQIPQNSPGIGNSERNGSVVAPGWFRAAHALAAGLQPHWHTQRFMAQLLGKLGCVREALDVYTRLGAIPDVIECFKSLGKLDRAEVLIREELETGGGRTPQMLSYLGDVTDNPEYYLEAWDLSGRRYGRAQKQLGLLHLRRNMLEGAAEAFLLATTTLPTSDQPWYNLGYCGMQTEKYTLAAKAYRRVVDLDPESADGWNNLAACYMHLKDHGKAFFIIQEALRANFENWKICDNFLTLAVETGHWSDAVRSVHKLLDLQKSSEIDAQLLVVLAQNASHDVLSDLRTLLARVTATIPSGDAWFAYATALARSGGLDFAKSKKMAGGGETEKTGVEGAAKMDALTEVLDPEIWDKYAKAVTKSLAMASQTPNWEKELEKMQKLLAKSIDILEQVSTVVEKTGKWPPSQQPRSTPNPLASLKLTSNSIISRVRRSYEATGATLPDEIESAISQILGLVSKIFQ